MKICFDYEIFWKQKFSGVASRYYYNLIKYLSKNKNINLKVFASIYLTITSPLPNTFTGQFY